MAQHRSSPEQRETPAANEPPFTCVTFPKATCTHQHRLGWHLCAMFCYAASLQCSQSHCSGTSQEAECRSSASSHVPLPPAMPQILTRTATPAAPAPRPARTHQQPPLGDGHGLVGVLGQAHLGQVLCHRLGGVPRMADVRAGRERAAAHHAWPHEE